MAEDFVSRRDAARASRASLSSLPAKKVMNSNLDPKALILGRFPDKADYKVYQSSTMRMLAAVKLAPSEPTGPTLTQHQMIDKLSAPPPHLARVRVENKARREALAGHKAGMAPSRHQEADSRARTEDAAALSFLDSGGDFRAYPRRDTL